MSEKYVLLICSTLLALGVFLIGPMQWHHLASLILSLFAFVGFMKTAKLKFFTAAGFGHAFTFGIYLLITIAFFLANHFTGNGINFDVLTQLQLGSLSAGFYTFESYHLKIILLISLFLIIYSLVKFSPGVESTHLPFWCKATIVFLMFALHPFTTSSGQLATKLLSSEKAEFIVEILKTNRLSNEAIESARSNNRVQPNVLMIYLESLERTYFDPRYYQNLLTELQDLTTQGEDFTSVKMPWGATHTIAGMIASQCGVPINTPRGGKHQHGDSDIYMPQAQCLNDITKDLGYENLFYQGARLNFTNKGGFMRAHGYDEVKGLDELREPSTPKSSIGPWGLHDAVLFGKVEKRLHELFSRDREKPFFFTILSLDTHDAFGSNRYSKWCIDNGLDKYEGADHKIQHAVYCSDKLIARFIKDVRNRWGEDLVIAMISDHGAYPFNMGEKLKLAESKKDRNLIFTIFDSRKKPVESKRELSSLDIGATILGHITDNQLNTIGLGISAYDDSRQNLVEQLGQSGLDRALQSSNLSLGKLLWKMPSFANADITVDVDSRSVTIDSSRYTMPVALMLNRSGEIIDFYGKDIHERMALLKVSPRFIWAGRCKYISELLDTDGDDDDTCLTLGNLAHEKFFSRVLSDSITLKYSDYRKYLQPESKQPDHDLVNERLYGRSGKNSVFDVVEIMPSTAVGEFAIVDISSTMGIQANLVHHTAFPTMEERLNLERRNISKFGYPSGNGLYLLQIEAGNLEVLYHWPTCTDNEAQGLLTVNQVLDQQKDSPTLILTSAREVRCDTDDLNLP